MTITIFKPLTTFATDTAYGAVIDGLENGVEYQVKIIASNDKAVSPPSDPLDVRPFPTPTPFSAPGAPVLNGVTPKPLGCSFSFDESSDGTKPFDNFCKATPTIGGTPIIAPCNEVAVMGEFFGDIEGLSPSTEYSLVLYSTNQYGQSPDSNAIKFVTDNAVPQPEKITSTTGRTWDADGYHYLYWDTAGAFTATVNQNVTVDAYLVGGGGGGHGQLMPIGTGGSGGGGAVTQTLGLNLTPGSITGTVGAGAAGGSTADAQWSTFANESALGGGTSQGKADGSPSTDTTIVPDTFNKCAAFLWNVPTSLVVSGQMVWDKNNQPNGVVYGQGGGGTNGTVGNSKAGNGQSGIVVIRYAKV